MKSTTEVKNSDRKINGIIFINAVGNNGEAKIPSNLGDSIRRVAQHASMRHIFSSRLLSSPLPSPHLTSPYLPSSPLLPLRLAV